MTQTETAGRADRADSPEIRLIDSIARTNLAAIDPSPGMARRPQHPKHHGCVRARFVVGDVPVDLRHGLFAKPGEYVAWVRFSNGRQVDDRKADAHGMAIKVCGVAGAGDWITPELAQEGAQDFILVDHETFFTGDLADYERINRLIMGEGWGKLALLPRLALTRLGTLLRIRKFASKTPASPLGSSYFSTTPYRLGPEAVKFLAVPRDPSAAQPAPADTEDRLAAGLHEALARGPVSFDFCVDVRTDPEAQPIDDPSVAWSQVPGARRDRIAVLELLRQEVVADAPLAEAIAFSPWRCLAAHEPLGAINRARRQTYEATSWRRHEVNGVAPAE